MKMIAQRQSILPFIFSAAVATTFVVIWTLGLLGVIEVESPSQFVFSLIVYFFFLPLAILMWIRVFYVPFAARIDEITMTFWSIDLFPRRVFIPSSSVYDVRVTEKDVAGDSIPVLRLFLTDCEVLNQIRSVFKSSAHFGFHDTHFDCALGLRAIHSEALACKIRLYLETRRGEQDAALKQQE